jgi:uncharacterized membrane protein YedE/YeeE
VLPILAALGAGIVFGLGLGISQMTHPEKIKDFLDLAAIATGGWDPSLLFVMGGALLVAMVFFRIGRPPLRPFLSGTFAHNWRRQIDGKLIGGSAIFGLGWGLVGLCPGPAIADLSLIPGEAVTFVAAMAAGSWAVGLIRAARANARVSAVPAE